MLSKEEILDKENNKPDEMVTDWVTVIRSAALKAMDEYLHQHLSQSREVGGYSREDMFQAIKYGVDSAKEHLSIEQRLDNFLSSLPVPLTDEVATMCVGMLEWAQENNYVYWSKAAIPFWCDESEYEWMGEEDRKITSQQLFKLYQQHLQSLK